MDPTLATVSTHAPVHLQTDCLLRVMKYINGVTCQTVRLTSASAAMYQKPTSRQWVQKLLDKEGLLCHWQMEQGQITITAEYAHQQRLIEVFESAFTVAEIPVGSRSHLLQSESQELFPPNERSTHARQKNDEEEQYKLRQVKEISFHHHDPRTDGQGQRSQDKQLHTTKLLNKEISCQTDKIPHEDKQGQTTRLHTEQTYSQTDEILQKDQQERTLSAQTKEVCSQTDESRLENNQEEMLVWLLVA